MENQHISLSFLVNGGSGLYSHFISALIYLCCPISCWVRSFYDEVLPSLHLPRLCLSLTAISPGSPAKTEWKQLQSSQPVRSPSRVSYFCKHWRHHHPLSTPSFRPQITTPTVWYNQNTTHCHPPTEEQDSLTVWPVNIERRRGGGRQSPGDFGGLWWLSVSCPATEGVQNTKQTQPSHLIW